MSPPSGFGGMDLSICYNHVTPSGLRVWDYQFAIIMLPLRGLVHGIINGQYRCNAERIGFNTEGMT